MLPQLPAPVVEAIGYLAGGLTTLSFLPQVLKTWRSRSAGDLSVVMLLIFVVGVALWLVYGLALRSWPVILANTVTLLLIGCLLGMKLAWDREPR